MGKNLLLPSFSYSKRPIGIYEVAKFPYYFGITFCRYGKFSRKDGFGQRCEV